MCSHFWDVHGMFMGSLWLQMENGLWGGWKTGDQGKANIPAERQWGLGPGGRGGDGGVAKRSVDNPICGLAPTIAQP